MTGNKGGSSLSPEFQLKEGELIEFNDIWLAEIVDLIEVRETVSFSICCLLKKKNASQKVLTLSISQFLIL